MAIRSRFTDYVGGGEYTSPEARNGLVLALVGVVFFGCLLGPLAIRQGLVALERISANPTMSGSVRAKFAIAIGAFDVAFSLATVAYYLARN